MKRILSVLLVICLITTMFIGCSSNDQNNNKVENKEPEGEVAATLPDFDLNTPIVDGELLLVGYGNSEFLITVESDVLTDVSDIIKCESLYNEDTGEDEVVCSVQNNGADKLVEDVSVNEYGSVICRLSDCVLMGDAINVVELNEDPSGFGVTLYSKDATLSMGAIATEYSLCLGRRMAIADNLLGKNHSYGYTFKDNRVEYATEVVIEIDDWRELKDDQTYRTIRYENGAYEIDVRVMGMLKVCGHTYILMDFPCMHATAVVGDDGSVELRDAYGDIIQPEEPSH